MISARVLAFATLEPALWGVVWAPEGSDPARLALVANRSTEVLPVSLGAAGAEEPWSLEGADASLTIVPGTAPRSGGDPDGRLHSVDVLGTITGHVILAGARHEVNAPGWRSNFEARVDAEGVDSFRHVAGWTRDDDLVAVVSLRPRKARGHEGDLMAAAVLDPAGGPAVVDPRLSTTYAQSGAPRRTSLELWFEESAEEPEEDASAHYPRRAAGEAVGSGIDWEVSGFALHAELLSWHTRGEEGVGIYIVGRRT